MHNNCPKPVFMIEQVENGFAVIPKSEKTDGYTPSFDYKSTRVFNDYGHMTNVLAEDFGVMIKTRFEELCFKPQTPDEMRDELGELRRFKERAIKGKAEIEARLANTTNSLNETLKLLRDAQSLNETLSRQMFELHQKKEKRARR